MKWEKLSYSFVRSLTHSLACLFVCRRSRRWPFNMHFVRLLCAAHSQPLSPSRTRFNAATAAVAATRNASLLVGSFSLPLPPQLQIQSVRFWARGFATRTVPRASSLFAPHSASLSRSLANLLACPLQTAGDWGWPPNLVQPIKSFFPCSLIVQSLLLWNNSFVTPLRCPT